MENISLRINLNKNIENERECQINPATMIANSRFILIKDYLMMVGIL
jgi:hypothetical protein